MLRDAGCAAIRKGAALRAAGASAAATAGRREGIFSGCGLGAGGCGGSAANRWPGELIWSAELCGGGIGPRSPPCGLSWAGLLQFGRVCGSASGGGAARVGCTRGSGGLAWGYRAAFGGPVWVIGRSRCAVGRGALCGGCVWVARCGAGEARLAGGVCGGRVWVSEPRAGGPGRGARGCARWWACVSYWVGSGKGGVGGLRLGLPAVCRFLCQLAAV